MKIYCLCCDKVQPVRIDNCRDAKTNEPFQDIVCAECDLVIASGTDIAPPKQNYLAGVPPMLPQMRDGETIVVAQPEQEPVAWLIWLHGPAGHFDHKQFAEMEFERRNKEYPDPDRKLLPLYTSPPHRKPLTDEEILAVARNHYNPHQRAEISFARAIEAKLKEKNA